VEVGGWLYSGDPGASDRDEVRRLVGDVKAGDRLLSDQEIEFALSKSTESAPADSASTSTLAVNGTTAAGATAIDLDAAVVTGTIYRGTTFTIAGSSQRYRVTNESDAAANGFTALEFLPGLVAEASDGAVVSLRQANINEAAALCCDWLAAEYAREVSRTVAPNSIQLDQRFAHFRQLADRLRALTSSVGGFFGARLVRV
jgi:hypothetical protein